MITILYAYLDNRCSDEIILLRTGKVSNKGNV